MSDDERDRERRGAAVFKYGLVRHYSASFAARTGGRSAGRRAVFVDGYPGPGQLDDGSPGSPLLLAQDGPHHASDRADGAAVTGIFVEDDRTTFANLRATLAHHAAHGFDYRLFSGELADHLPAILRLVPDSALFALLDPVATALDNDQITGQLLVRGRAPTEALVRFDVTALAGLARMLRSAAEAYRMPDGEETRAADRLDRFLGGQWWQRDATTIGGEDDLGRAWRVAQRIAGRFAHQVSRRTGTRAAVLPVRLHPSTLGQTVLVLFARDREDFWHFADALGRAGQDWLEQWRAEEIRERRRTEERSGQWPLFTADQDPLLTWMGPNRSRHESRWVHTIGRNISRLLAEGGPLVLADRVVEVYGDVLGLADTDHIRQAVAALHRSGRLTTDGSAEAFHTVALRQVGR